MFIGYNSDDPDGFSIVILRDVAAGTQIFITDRGWSSTTGFRDDNNGEGTIRHTFNQAYPCGTSLYFLDIGGANDWAAYDEFGNAVGTTVILTSTTESPAQDPDGLEFNTASGLDGDQIFIYQSPEPNPGNQSSFVAGIHMNGGAWNANNGDDYSSQQPSGLPNNAIIRFNSEVDNAIYDCTPSSGSSAILQAAITNDNGAGGLIADNANNWAENNNWINLSSMCSFCCGTPNPPFPNLTAPEQVANSEVFTITIDGVLASGEVWELYTTGCGFGTPVQTTSGTSFTVTAPSTGDYATYFVGGSFDGSCDCREINVCLTSDPLALCSNCNADDDVCGPCFLPAPYDNPELDSGCYEVKLIIILDESGSINNPTNYEPQVRDGVLAFLNSLNGQNIECAIIEFSDLARVVTNYTIINTAFINQVQNYFNDVAPLGGQYYMPLGGTNWHAAMSTADALDPADLVLFFTDGQPTAWNTIATDYCGNGSTTQTPEIVNPVKISNKLKQEDTHMFMLGVGGVTQANLIAMSGPIEYQAGVNTIGNSDFSIGNFEDLADDLEEFVLDLCSTPFRVTKTVNGPACNGFVQFKIVAENLGTESAATAIQIFDTLATGYGIPFYGLEYGNKKFCVGAGCNPQGQPQPPKGFIWSINAIPPLGRDSILVTAPVNPSGNYTNIVWARGFNVSLTSDTLLNPVILDDEPPVITCPATITIECDESTLPDNTGEATAEDNANFPLVITYEDDVETGSCPGESTITRTWTVEDACLNSDICVQTIHIVDTQGPNVTCPANITLSCGDSTDPEDLGEATAIDLCDEDLVLDYDDFTTPGDCPQEFEIERTWMASDDCGNDGSCVQIISIEDNTDPVLTCPANITIQCTDNSLPANTGSLTATDNCGGAVDSDYTDEIQNQTCTNSFVIERTWHGSDACDNEAMCIQLITVIDTVDPEIVCPANISINCLANTLPVSTGFATGTDNCDPAPDVTYADITIAGACPASYTIQRHWTVTDLCLNTSDCIQTIFVYDSTAPVITLPANVTIACTDDTTPSNTGSATASDGCSAIGSISHFDEVAPGDCPSESTISRYWIAEDACLNRDTQVQLITLIDIVVPVITCPSNVTIECTDSTEPDSTGIATATDNCDPTPEVTYTDVTVSGDCPQSFTIQRTWVAEDTCGNIEDCIQLIFIQDITPPDITCPADVTITCLESSAVEDTGEATATDICDAAPIITYDDEVVETPENNGHLLTRTWTATDACGNSSQCEQLIVIENPLIPAIEEDGLDTICSGGEVTFTGGDLGISGVTYSWTFGSGSSPSMATGIGSHDVTYVTSGNNGTEGAWVILTIDVAGCNEVTDTVANVLVNPIPVAGVTTTGGNPCILQSKLIESTQPFNADYVYEWNFGLDAVPANASSYGPHSVYYLSAGAKTVSLVVHGNAPGANCTDTATMQITVNPCPGVASGFVRRVDNAPIVGVQVLLFKDFDRDTMPDSLAFRTAFTNASGGYTFVNLNPGYYLIQETQPLGYTSILDADISEDLDSLTNWNNTDDIIPVTIIPNEFDNGNNFTEAVSPGIISGYVFEDIDNNNSPSGFEGIPGVSVNLHADNNTDGVPDGAALSTVMTTSTGYYVFGDLTIGNFVIVQSQPAGYNSIQDIDFTNDGDQVANSNTNDNIIPVTLQVAEHDADNWFIEQSPCSKVVSYHVDGQPGSLRYMIDCAENGDTITFHPLLADQTLDINAGRLIIDKEITLLSGLQPTVRIKFNIDGGFLIEEVGSLHLKNLHLISGLTGYDGAAIENQGSLILEDVLILPNPLLDPVENLIFNTSGSSIEFKGNTKIED